VGEAEVDEAAEVDGGDADDPGLAVADDASAAEAALSNACRTITIATTSAGTDGRPRPDGN